MVHMCPAAVGFIVNWLLRRRHRPARKHLYLKAVKTGRLKMDSRFGRHGLANCPVRGI